MTGLAMMLKAFGITITDQNLRMIEALIPQIPGKINEFVTAFNAALEDNKSRLTAIEQRQARIEEALGRIEGALRHDTERTGIDTERNGATNGSNRGSSNRSRQNS